MRVSFLVGCVVSRYISLASCCRHPLILQCRPFLPGYDTDQTIFSPYLFDTWLFRYDTHVEVTSTSHAAVMRFTFPEYVPEEAQDQTRRVIVRLPEDHNTQESDAAVYDEDRNAITGRTSSNSGGIPANGDFGMYIQVTSDQPHLRVDQVGRGKGRGGGGGGGTGLLWCETDAGNVTS
jgi:hypothetical protein